MPPVLPRTVREWEKLFQPLNAVIRQSEAGTAVLADNLPPQSAAYVTLSNNASLTGDRVLTPVENELEMVDYGPGSQVTLGLATAVKAVLPLSGVGSPEGVVTASPGTLYLNASGGVSTTLYVKTSGTGNTGWTAK